MPDWQAADEDQLLTAAQDGDADAFGELYERHAEAIFRFLYSHLDSRLDAEDLTEEVFLRVWRSIGSYRQQGVPFIAYLFRISRNALIDHYRRSSQSKGQMPLEEGLISDPGADPRDQALENSQRQEIRQLLEQLREDYRTVLILRFLADLSPDETAEAMGKSSGAVRVLQHRALAALRKLVLES